jgi:cytochrome c-type biogenesis protein
MGLIAGAIAHYHAPLYYAGAVLMFVLAGLSLSGRMWSLPSFIASPDTTRGDTASFFSLGVFSGIASSCCAPVLAGVMTLSALSGSAIGGLTLGLAYVFGMVFPLFVMALVWDKAHLSDRRWMRARPVRLRMAGRVLATNTLNIGVAVAFAVMGVFVAYLAAAGEMTGGTAFQSAVGRDLAGMFERIQTWLSPVPEAVLGVGLLAVAGVFVVATLRRRPPAQADVADDPPSCHADPFPDQPAPAQTSAASKENRA